MERSVGIPDLFGKQNRPILMLEGDGRNVERAIKDDFLGFLFMQFARRQIHEIKKKFFFFLSSTSLLLTHLPPPSCMHAQSCNSMDCSHQAPLFMDFSRQEYWSGLPRYMKVR